jgi:hypothetical protein
MNDRVRLRQLATKRLRPGKLAVTSTHDATDTGQLRRTAGHNDNFGIRVPVQRAHQCASRHARTATPVPPRIITRIDSAHLADGSLPAAHLAPV